MTRAIVAAAIVLAATVTVILQDGLEGYCTSARAQTQTAPQCGRIPFQVTGTVLDNDQRIVLTGQAPQVGRDCRARGSYASNLEFRRLNATAAGRSQKPLVEATQAPGAEQSRSETPKIEAGNAPSELVESSPGAPTARPPVTNVASSAAKDLDNHVWAVALIPVVVVVWAAAMLAAA
jgi:hypothetical protein